MRKPGGRRDGVRRNGLGQQVPGPIGQVAPRQISISWSIVHSRVLAELEGPTATRSARSLRVVKRVDFGPDVAEAPAL